MKESQNQKEKEKKKLSTPIKKKVRKFEEIISNKEEKGKSPKFKLKSIKKVKEKEGRSGKVQACIKRFLEPSKQPFGASGSYGRNGTAGRSRLDPGTSPPEGGKVGESKTEAGRGSIGPWEGRTGSLSNRFRTLNPSRTSGERNDENSLDLQDRGEKGKKIDPNGARRNPDREREEPELEVENGEKSKAQN